MIPTEEGSAALVVSLEYPLRFGSLVIGEIRGEVPMYVPVEFGWGKVIGFTPGLLI